MTGRLPRTAVRLAATCAMLLALMLASAPPALADAAGPTDYRTDIVEISPAEPRIELEIIGGDAFVAMTVNEPIEVIVVGYQGEPYIRFAPDGTVSENQRSPAVWLNQERYGTEDVPDFAIPDAPPVWVEVATGGSYAWHDHRSHWMSPIPPLGKGPGDQVLEAVVPIDVDGERVAVTVASYRMAKPSLLPTLAGAIAATAAGVAAWRWDRRPRALVMVAVAAAALALGVTAFLSVPRVTQPSTLLWLLPLLALVAGAIGWLVRYHTATTVYLDGLAVVAGATLAAWGLLRFEAVRRALIPSNAPAWMDRATIAIAICFGVIAVAQGLYGLVNPKRLLQVAHDD